MQAIYTENVQGYTIDILPDIDAINPYEDWDMVGTLYHWHRRGFIGTDISHTDPADIQELVNETERMGGIVVPVYLYEHGGQTIRTTPFSCMWDSGKVGFWIVNAAEIRKEWGDITEDTREKACKCIDSQVTSINDYLTGNVHGFIVTDPHGERVYSCWGFFGDYDDQDGPLDEARDIVKHALKHARKEYFTKLKAMIAHRAPLEVRQAFAQAAGVSHAV